MVEKKGGGWEGRTAVCTMMTGVDVRCMFSACLCVCCAMVP